MHCLKVFPSLIFGFAYKGKVKPRLSKDIFSNNPVFPSLYKQSVNTHSLEKPTKLRLEAETQSFATGKQKENSGSNA